MTITLNLSFVFLQNVFEFPRFTIFLFADGRPVHNSINACKRQNHVETAFHFPVNETNVVYDNNEALSISYTFCGVENWTRINTVSYTVQLSC